MKHTLTNIDAAAKKGLCAVCGVVDLFYRKGRKQWVCKKHRNEINLEDKKRRGVLAWDNAEYTANQKEQNLRSLKGHFCQRCGFIPEHHCQLDVHHKDENHYNNSPENLETLCANCHRLIHFSRPENHPYWKRK